MKKTNHKQTDRVRINEGIRATEVRVIDDEQGNLGVMTREEALALAREQGVDLIEIAGHSKPPVVKIMDYGRFQYDMKKRRKALKEKTKGTESEVKNIQIKIGTSENDIAMKARQASAWLEQGHRIKAELYLRGRSKYMEKDFLQDRLKRILHMLSVPYKVVEDFKKSPKGIALTIERDKSKKATNTESASVETADSQPTNQNHESEN